MPRKTVDDLIAELEKILVVFKGKPGFKVGDMDEQKLTTTITGLRSQSRELEDTRALLTSLVNGLNDGVAEGQTMQSRCLSGIRAAFGPDSSEYEQAGGVRTSERKKTGPKKKP
jgi:hypothetical protein